MKRLGWLVIAALLACCWYGLWHFGIWIYNLIGG